MSKFKQYDSNRQGGQVSIRYVPEIYPPLDGKRRKALPLNFKISPPLEKTHKVLLERGDLGVH